MKRIQSLITKLRNKTIKDYGSTMELIDNIEILLRVNDVNAQYISSEEMEKLINKKIKLRPTRWKGVAKGIEFEPEGK